jgi:hypothetical protein
VLIVRLTKDAGGAEAMIRRVLTLLFARNIAVSGVAKGHGLEKRVMELTQ